MSARSKPKPKAVPKVQTTSGEIATSVASTGNVGRPCSLTVEMSAAICEVIASGCPFNYACDAVGITYKTFKSWRRQGNSDLRAKKLSAYSAFCTALKKANGQFVAEGVKRIKEASQRHWTAYAWLLERRHPEDFATDRQELRRAVKKLSELEKALAEILDAKATKVTK